MPKYSKAYDMLYIVWVLLFSNLVQAADVSRVIFHLKCSENMNIYKPPSRDVLDTRIELSSADIYQTRFQSKLSPTRSAANPVDVELTIKPTIFSGKIHNYVKLDVEIKTYDHFDNQLLYTGARVIHLIDDGIPWHKKRRSDSFSYFNSKDSDPWYIFNPPAYDPKLTCETNLVAVVPGAEMVRPKKIDFQAKIIFNSDWSEDMSQVANCSLAIGESCEIYLQKSFNKNQGRLEPAQVRREITLVDVAIDAVSKKQVLFFKYNDSVLMRQITPDFGKNIDWDFGEDLYVKSSDIGTRQDKRIKISHPGKL